MKGECIEGLYSISIITKKSTSYDYIHTQKLMPDKFSTFVLTRIKAQSSENLHSKASTLRWRENV